ncbi:hypothetical protein LEP1GSC050_1352 [Leptospira broomii serovar Hurstbridge str. 5399]|uniref:Uncharacterized protein n=1 Tax=Leptospira broomii serovar Hurstbridge str. 5399 TaxID=1049789 RepID=T0F6T3_9LEPT|nr:hypothetical protein [Leptospira broomii]EQA43232.1 hypothetical protein LEP1GSC050_1352 [Leptospira broomii serovar Hurstbridge str. 5399]
MNSLSIITIFPRVCKAISFSSKLRLWRIPKKTSKFEALKAFIDRCEVKFVKLRLHAFLLKASGFAFLFSLSYPVYSQEKDRWGELIKENVAVSLEEKQKKEDQETEKYRTKYFSVNPGISFSHTEAAIRRGDYVGLMTQSHYVKPNLFLEIKSRDFKISDWFGFQFLNSTSTFDMDNQEVDSLPDNITFNNFGLVNFINTRLQNRTKREDLGTDVKGFYSLLLPVLFLGKSNSDGFRLGVGGGIGYLNADGNLYIKNRNEPFLALSSIDSSGNFSPHEYIGALGTYNYLSGLKDPLMLMNSLSNSVNYNQQAYAAIVLADGYTSRKLDLLTFNQLVFNLGVDPYSAAFLSYKPKTKEHISNKDALAFNAFLEFPTIFGIKSKLSYTIISAHIQNQFHASLTNVTISAFYPIQF